MRRRDSSKRLLLQSPLFPASVRAQRPGRTPLIAVLMAFNQSHTDGQRYAAVFRETLRQANGIPAPTLRSIFAGTPSMPSGRAQAPRKLWLCARI